MGILKNAAKIFVVVTIAYFLLAKFLVIGFIGDIIDLTVAVVIGGASAVVYIILVILAGIARLFRR